MKEPKKTRAAKHEDSYEEKLLRFHNKEARKNRVYAISCLGAICLFLLGLGITLLALGSKYDVRDLYILGPIFLVSGVGVLIMILVEILKYWSKKSQIKPNKTQFEPEYELKLTMEPEISQNPTPVQLYGQDKYKHETPDSGSVTVFGVQMPPPPPVFVPNDAVDSKVPVIETTTEEAKPCEGQCNDDPP